MENKSDAKKKKITIAAVAVFIVAILAAGGYYLMADTANFKTITPKQAYDMMKSRNDVIIIDIREYSELREGWIEGSVFMPLPEIMQGRMAPPKDRPVLLVCAVGGRSFGLGRAMIPYGWTEVYNLESGIAGWKMLGLPLKYR